MPWFNVDDGFPFHRKVVLAGNAAIGLWTRAGAWCAKELTDGFVPDHMVPTMGTKHQAEKLVKAGLWVREDARRGYQFHQYAEDGRNPTRADVLKKREQAAEKKRRQRERNSHESESPQVDDARPEGTVEGLPGGVPGGVNDPPPLPSPPSKRTRRNKPGDYPSEFEQWWVLYPKRKGSKGSKFEAAKSWDKAVGFVSADVLLAAVKRYVDSQQVRDGYAKDAATWLNKCCWEEYDAPVVEDPNTWLKGEWHAGRVRVIEERTGLRYAQPDIPPDLTEKGRIEDWLRTQARKWIADNHDRILSQLHERRTA